MTALTLAMKLGTMVAAGTIVARIVYAVARTPSRIALTTGLRGLKRQRGISESELWAEVEPLVRWLGVRVRGLLTAPMREAINRRIALAGDYLGLVAEELLALSFILAGVGVAFGAFVGSRLELGVLAMMIMPAYGAAAPWLRLSDATRVRLGSIRRGMPYFVDLIALSVGAGLDFPGAIRQIIDKASDPTDPVIEELGLVLRSLRLGRTRKSALEEFAARAPIEAVREFCTTIVQAEERGNGIGEALTILSTTARLRRTFDAEEKASQMGVALVAPLGLMFVAVLVIGAGPLVLSMDTMFQ